MHAYNEISKAPLPSERYKDFLNLQWDKKIVTIEPIMDFDLDTFVKQIVSIKPKVVFLGYNSHPKSVPLPEPKWNKTLGLMCSLRKHGIEVLPKEIPKNAYKDYFV